MRVSTRLYIAVIPAVLGMLTVAGLSYWGRYARVAPPYVIVLAAAAATASLVAAWHNTRYVARRLEQLASRRADIVETDRVHLTLSDAPLPHGFASARVRAGGSSDELDSIGDAIGTLERDAAFARADAVHSANEARRRQAEYAILIADASTMSSKRVDDVRMPLYILLNTDLGQLNEDQEELLRDADSALLELSTQLQLLRNVADTDTGALCVAAESVHVGDLLHGLEPMLQALATKSGVRLVTDVAPGLPRASGNFGRLRDALRLTLSDDIRYALPGTTVSVTARPETTTVVITVESGPHSSHVADRILAERLITTQGGTVTDEGDRAIISLPRFDAGTVHEGASVARV